jgi:sulfur carrier protein
MQDTKLATAPGEGPRTGAAMPPGLSVTVNGAAQRTVAATLSGLLADLGYSDARVATAVNGEFVPARLRAERPLAEGDAVEIVAPRQGG